MVSLTPGETAPAFTLPDQHDTPVSLSSFGPGRVIVYFYPAALTPACTVEAVDFTTHLAEFTARGIRIVGISPDPVDTLAAFTAKNDLAITLLSDPQRQVIDAYGAWGTKTLYGKQVEGIIRSTFLVDVAVDGTATVEQAEYNVRATGHVERLLKHLG
ncbi:MAG: peroxiredoxin [Propionibacteriaceae bacterium]|nr:peroxiredoxin [Propionibacteriaceae bacterium]